MRLYVSLKFVKKLAGPQFIIPVTGSNEPSHAPKYEWPANTFKRHFSKASIPQKSIANTLRRGYALLIDSYRNVSAAISLPNKVKL